MKGKALHKLLPLIALAVILTITSCLERVEEITIAENGETTIKATFDGDKEDFEAPLVLPSGPEWTILEEESHSDDKKIKLEAEIVVPYGKPLPETFAKVKTGEENINLRFPTQVRYWSEGNRTYYEFKRTYQARKYFRYNMMADEEIDKELEKRVMDEGIFNLNEGERKNYVMQLSKAYSYFHMMMLGDVLGDLAKNNVIKASSKKNIEEKAKEVIIGILSEKQILDILKLDDSAMTAAYDELIKQLHDEFRQLYKKEIGDKDKMKMQHFESSLEKVWMEYQITQKLDVSEFVIGVKMPGEIISTNGITETEDENVTVGWTFKGSDLHDRDIPLYALSVVEH